MGSGHLGQCRIVRIIGPASGAAGASRLIRVMGPGNGTSGSRDEGIIIPPRGGETE